MSTVQAAPGDPVALLWKIARMWMADALDAFGGPVEIAALIARKARAAVKRRLKALEALVMKLLLIEASRLKAPAPRRRAAATADCRAPAAPSCASEWAAAAPDECRRAAPDPRDPPTWRMRFQLRVPPQAAPVRTPVNAGPRVRDLGPPLLVRDVFADMARRANAQRMAALRAARNRRDDARERAKAEKLARRFEALKRVLADPAPYARRLWRKLKALARRAYDAAMRIGMRLVRYGEPAVDSHATFQSCRVAGAFSTDSS